jgi:hypothetical protein
LEIEWNTLSTQIHVYLLLKKCKASDELQGDFPNLLQRHDARGKHFLQAETQSGQLKFLVGEDKTGD